MSKESTINLALVAVILLVIYYVFDSLFGSGSIFSSGTSFPFLYNAATGTLSDSQKQAAIAQQTAEYVKAGMSPQAALGQATQDVAAALENSPGCGTWLQCDYNLLKTALTE